MIPVSFAQRRLWFLQQLDGPSATYNIPFVLRLRGDLDIIALRAAVTDIVTRHESLRTLVVQDQDGTPGQRILPASQAQVPFRTGDAGAQGVELDEQVAALARQGFELSTDLPLRVDLLRCNAGEHVLVFVFHHIAADGSSMAPFLRDLMSAYTARRRGESPGWQPLAVQYRDYAVWQQRLLGDQDDPQSVAAAQLAHWRRELTGLPQPLTLPLDRPRPSVAGHAGDHVSFELDPQLMSRLSELAARHGATAPMVAQAALAVLLAKLGAGEDVSIGSPIEGRTDEALDDLIGSFINTWVLRADLSADPSFAELLEQVRERSLAAYDHQDVPFERLVELLGVERSTAYQPLFQVMLAWQFVWPRLELPGLEVFPVPVGTGTAKFDLHFSIVPDSSGRAYGRLEYATELFDHDTAVTITDRFVRVLRQAVATPQLHVGDFGVLAPQERDQLLHRVNDTAEEVPRPGLVELIAQQAAATPHALAVVAEDSSLTYAQVDQRAGQLARWLSERGVGPETLVAVSLPRSADLVIALLGVLRSGAAYLPIDPGHPAARTAQILADARPVLTLDSATLAAAKLESASSEPLLVPTTAQNVAYTIYTSGSTGRPKGVEISRAALDNFLSSMARRVPLGPADRWLAVTTVSFDIAALELYLPLIRGAAVVLAGPDTVLDPSAVLAAVHRHEVTVVQATPSFWQLLTGHEPDAAKGLRVLTGGEALPVRLAEVLTDKAAEVINVYGPTETTIWSTAAPVTSGERVTIGTPLGNTQVYVLDSRLHPVPAGVQGDLYIAGEGVARGYRGRAGLTCERFVACPFGRVGARMYRTGDVARWGAHGRLEYLGRSDFQLKVRGFRIEPGEIERALTAHPEVRQAVATVREDAPGDKRLVGYLVLTAATLPPELLGELRDELPDYMVPSALVPLDEIPLTPNGKVDLRALPAPDYASTSTATAPRTPLERDLSHLFAEVLGLAEVGVEDDYFSLGGDSIRSVQLVARARAQQIRITVRDVFEYRTVARIADKMDERPDEAPSAPAQPLTELSSDEILSLERTFGPVHRVWPVLPAQAGMLFHSMLAGEAFDAYHQQLVFGLTGPVDPERLRHAGQALLDRHPVLRAAFPERADGTLLQVVSASGVSLPWTHVELDDKAFEDFLERDRAAHFDIHTPPLLRMALVTRGPDRSELVLTAHHALFDGWSIPLLLQDLLALYAGHGDPAGLPPAPDYEAFLSWRARQRPEDASRAWAEELAGVEEPLLLAPDAPLVDFQQMQVPLPPTLGADLTRLARTQGLTLNTLVQGAWGLLLGQLTGRRDVLFGATVSGRPAEVPEAGAMVGVFINTVPIRLTYSPQEPLARVLQHLQARQGALMQHHHHGLTQIQQSTGLPSLFDTLVVFESYPIDTDSLARALESTDGLGVTGLRPTNGTHYPLTLMVVPDPDLNLVLHYTPGAFERSTVQEFSARLVRILSALVSDPDLPVGRLDVLSATERERVLAHTVVPTPETTITDLVQAQARRTPDLLAVESGDVRLTYRELVDRSGTLAGELARLGVGPESVVAVCLPRSADLVVALLAVLRAGGAYLPLDPAYPSHRLDAIFLQARPELVIGDSRTVTVLPGHEAPVVLVDQLDPSADQPETAPRAGQLAYVMYTSGSTGRPKGVAITHANVVNGVLRLAPEVGMSQGRRMLAAASVNFDVSAFEIFTTLATGGVVEVARDVLVLGEKPHWRGSVVSTVPSAFAELVDHLGGRVDLDTVVFAGEALPRSLVERTLRVFPQARLVNAYGQTESFYATTHLVGQQKWSSAPIGRALGNMRTYLLGPGLTPVPPGAVGELYVGGNIARGYWNESALTAERFVADPYGAPGARMYRTGDLARWIPDHRREYQLEYLGRGDQQVKIRGFRIEPAEVEVVLTAHPPVSRAAVTTRETAAGRQLLAYVVAEAGVTAEQVRRFAAERLPDFMVPSSVTVLDRLPLMPNGKLDRAALPEPDFATTAYRAPASGREQTLARLFAEVLGLERVGADDSFFDLGGHSLLATRLISRVRAELALEIPIRKVFDLPTVAQLAAWSQESAAPRRPRLRKMTVKE